jgi:ankyrin repeat protein
MLNGDAGVLSQMIDEYPSIVHERFDDLPYGNIRLRGGTLLHLAVDYGELECIDVLLKKGAQVNALAKTIDGVGGQTPIFHAITSPMPDMNIAALEHLLDKAGKWIDRSIKATFERFGKKQTPPITALEFAQQESQGNQTRELALLRRMERPRIDDPHFAAAVDAIDAGDLERLKQLLREHPELATARAEESGSYAGPYFVRPALLWFVAENPHRTGRLPSNIGDIARAIIDAGASADDITYTAELVASGDVPRASGVDTQLLELLASRGADLTGALAAAVQESQTGAIATLLRLGAEPNLAAAAGLADLAALKQQLQSANIDDKLKQSALYNAAIHGQSDAIELLVREGTVHVDARVGLQVTALHLAAWNNHPDLVERLLALGADPTIRDGRFNATPAGWARHNGHSPLAQRLERAEKERSSGSTHAPTRVKRRPR